ncbi:lipocalin family protein [Thermomonas sp.]|uniref:lipocalin family protein n=1 Tax=Thermomonas sp. TaxID=1971895 RepID=UPI0024877BD3|nr:lipocalin family protein [Thermomonas sp.]MDI1254079.1 lipocalin family protein [Thermomonas sp.]
MLRKLSLLMALGMAAPSANAQDATLANDSVPTLDLQHYSGQWHEIAHLPMFFQRKCVANITATYSQKPDGTIGVLNACENKSGKRIASEGTARAVEDHPGRLKVRFAPDWLAWVPMVWADYWVVELDQGYQWAVVGGPSHKYLWILSRAPSMDRKLFDDIRARAAQRGYPVQNLVIAAPLD